MSLIFPDAGKLRVLDWITKYRSVPSTLALGLYKSNTSIVDATVWSDLTEADFTSYTRYTLSGGSWTAATIVSDRGTSTYGTSPQTWTNGGSAQTLYGFFLLDTSDNTLIAAEPISGGYSFSSAFSLGYLPRLTTQSEF